MDLSKVSNSIRYSLKSTFHKDCLSRIHTMADKRKNSCMKVSSKIDNIKETIWVKINNILSKYKTVNLGQGFPDFHPPENVLKHMNDIASKNSSPLLQQYSRSMGHARLVNALAKLYTPMFQCQASEIDENTFSKSMELDPMTNVIISVGAYGSLYLIFNALVDPGDECIIMEPAFDCYAPMIEVNKGVPVYVQLRPKNLGDGHLVSNDWVLDMNELEAVVTPKTKLIVLNTPHNPLGKVFSKKELEEISQFAIKHDLIVIADEVYEWISFQDPHIKIASLPGMWSRTLTIGSGGKTFSTTGWKTGWTIGPANFIYAMQMLQQNIINSSPTPIQEALARSLEDEIVLYNDPIKSDNCYLKSLGKMLSDKAENFANVLEKAKFKPVRANSGYFLVADMSRLIKVIEQDHSIDKSTMMDFQINEYLIKNAGINGIPLSAFYHDPSKGYSTYIRWCFAKQEDTLEKGLSILEKL